MERSPQQDQLAAQAQDAQQPPLGQFSSPVAQLPPQMFTTAAQLLDLTDKKLMVALRDGKTLFGVLRSWDQFGNLMMQDTIERIYVNKLFCDIPRGIFIIRGENVEMIGEIDLDKEDDIPEGFEEGDIETVHTIQKEELKKRKKKDKEKTKKMAKFGFEGESGEGIY